MSKFSDDQLKVIKEAQNNADTLVKDPAAFDKVFEEMFAKFDSNKDKTIGMNEYVAFINGLLTAAGKKKMDLTVAMYKFERADKDGDGKIDKDEFKKEILKKLREFAMTKY